MNQILDAYAAVKPNLDCHASGYPSAEKLRKTLCLGIPAFGKRLGSGFGEKRWIDNPGVQQIIRAVDAPDPRPVWVGLWGGANTLAQAIWQISRTRSPEQVSTFLNKLRIHSISDQDYAGTWLRQQFGGELFYIVTPCEGSRKGAREYHKAVWPGISGDRNGHGSENGQDKGGFGGAEKELISKAWLDQNIRRIGPLGKCYPRTVFCRKGIHPLIWALFPMA